MKSLFCTLLITTLLYSTPVVEACSVAMANYGAKGNVTSYNMDWFWTGGGLYSRGSGFQHQSLVGENGLKWKSKYKNLTFGTVTPDLPFGGVNEAGLTVFVLGAPKGITDQRIGLPAVNELEMISLLLDSAKNTKEAEDVFKKVRIQPLGTALHYMVCDGVDCFVADFKEKLNITKMKKFETVLTNEFYDIELGRAKAGVITYDKRFLELFYLLKNEPQSLLTGMGHVQQSGKFATRWNATVKKDAKGKSILEMVVDPSNPAKSNKLTFNLEEVFAQDFTKTMWISFEEMTQKHPKWKVMTEADIKNEVKFNIGKILEYQEHILDRGDDPAQAEKNFIKLEKQLINNAGSINKNFDLTLNCKDVVKAFL